MVQNYKHNPRTILSSPEFTCPAVACTRASLLQRVRFFAALLPQPARLLCPWDSLQRVRFFAALLPQPARLLCPWDSAGKNATAGGPVLLQGIFPTQGLKPRL